MDHQWTMWNLLKGVKLVVELELALKKYYFIAQVKFSYYFCFLVLRKLCGKKLGLLSLGNFF